VNLLTGEESTGLFGGEVSPAIEGLVAQAREAPREEAAAILWTAALSAPDSLPIHYLLYKLHAGLGELEPALKAATQGLKAAAKAAGLAADWTQVQTGDADFGSPGPARFWLFTLKALAFIHLRRGEPELSRQLLAHIQQLDPSDAVGASVVRSLLERCAEQPGPN
jgi:hypothetical protein